MIFPIRPTTTETRRIDDVNVRATPAVAGITAARGFNQPGVVVTIGDGARTLARSGQQPQSGNAAQNPGASGAPEDGSQEKVFAGSESKAGVEAVFNDKQDKTLPTSEEESERLATEESERIGVEEEGAFESVWGSDVQPDVDPKGVPYAALQRAASVQDLDVGDVAKALAHTQIAVRVLATQDNSSAGELGDVSPAGETPATDDVEPSRLSSVPTDGVPYEALQRAVTEAENAQTLEASAESVDAEAEARGVEAQSNAQALEVPKPDTSPTEPVFMPPENGGAPWGRAVPFEDESKRGVSAERPVQHQERPVQHQERPADASALA